MKTNQSVVIAFVIVAAFELLGGCAAAAPPLELIDARQAYQRAAAGLAAQLMPLDLYRAQEALAAAEVSFLDDSASNRTRDLAYVAGREARLAEALATSAAGKAASTMADSDSEATRDANKTRELIAGAKRRAAEIVEQNSLPQSKGTDSSAKIGGLRLRQPRPSPEQRPAGGSPSTVPAQPRKVLGQHKESADEMRVARILLVDDGRNRSDSVRRILKSPDYQVVEAADCDRAISLIGDRMFDLILLGFTLPNDSSVRVLASLKQYQLTTRVIVIGEEPGLESAVQNATLAARGYFPVP